MTQGDVNRWAVGWTWFAAIMLWMAGGFHVIAGLAGLADDGFLVEPSGYFFGFGLDTWTWLHLIVGVLLILAGLALLGGSWWARTLVLMLASLSILAAFAWMPWFPAWSIVIMAVDGFVIWAVTMRGDDAARAWAAQSPDPDVSRLVGHGGASDPMADH